MHTTKNSGSAARTAADALNPKQRIGSAAGERVRYFLPKAGSSSEHPELGQEVASEGEALVEAFKAGQLFYTVVAWRAAPEMNGSEAKIVKRPRPRS